MSEIDRRDKMFKYYSTEGIYVSTIDNYKRGKDMCYEFGGSIRMADGTVLFTVG